MNTLAEIVKRRASPGVLIFDMGERLLYSNQDALEMIAAFREIDLAEAGSEFVVPAEISTLSQEAIRQLTTEDRSNGGQLPHAVLVSEAGLAFSLRAFMMGDHDKGRTPTHIMVLMERIIEKHEVDFNKAEKDFYLSRRETDVLRLICQGQTNREISNHLFICEDTVKGHIKKIMQKMTVNSRSEIIVALK